jgi:glycine cleavage system transcriptional repressor
MPDSDRGEIVLVATGADRPGVLDDVSAFLHERHATILESRVSLLRGSFALLLLVRADGSALEKITRELPELQKSARLRAELRPAGDATPPQITALRLRARGPDPAAAVHRLSHLMRVLNVNIHDIRTDTTESSLGERHFELEMDLDVPRATPVVMLKQYVDGLAAELKMECVITSL